MYNCVVLASGARSMYATGSDRVLRELEESAGGQTTATAEIAMDCLLTKIAVPQGAGSLLVTITPETLAFCSPECSVAQACQHFDWIGEHAGTGDVCACARMCHRMCECERECACKSA